MAAKNWTLKEAVQVLVEGTNTEAMQELGKRFPLTSLAIAKMGNNEGANTLFGAMPDHMTMLKMERSLKEGVEESDEDQDDEVEAEEAGEEDFSSMSAKELMKLCDKRGIKVPHYGKNKQFYLDALTGGSAESEEEDDEDAANEAEEKEVPDYTEMTAMELYKLCKKRGIKAEPKQKAAVYIKLLKAADVDDAEGEEDEEWGEEEEAPAPAPKKGKAIKASGAKKEATKSAPKSSAKKVEKAEAEDEDDDWDI